MFSTIKVSRVTTANQNLHMHTITHKRVNNSDPGRQKVILGDKSDPGRQKLSWATKFILGDKSVPGRQKFSWAINLDLVKIAFHEPSANTQAQDGAFAEGGAAGPRRTIFAACRVRWTSCDTLP